MDSMAKDQFANDYTLVIDNDADAYREARDLVASHASIAEASDAMREQFESYICDVVERERELGNETGALLISQLLLHWGARTFDIIAKHYQEN